MKIDKKRILDGFSIPFFLAAPFNKEQEACDIAERIEHLSDNRLRCCSHWMYTPELNNPSPDELARIAASNRDDLDEASVLILFDGVSTSGGLHFEAGYFAGKGKLSIIVKAAEFLYQDKKNEFASNQSIYFTTGKKWTESVNMLHLDAEKLSKEGSVANVIARSIILTVAREVQKDIVFNPHMSAWCDSINSEAAKAADIKL